MARIAAAIEQPEFLPFVGEKKQGGKRPERFPRPLRLEKVQSLSIRTQVGRILRQSQVGYLFAACAPEFQSPHEPDCAGLLHSSDVEQSPADKAVELRADFAKGR